MKIFIPILFKKSQWMLVAVDEIVAKELQYRSDDLIHLFGKCFVKPFNTYLVKGGIEPVYLPANSSCAYHQVVFNRDYFSSALHEISHWCIAGQLRRLKIDYGYWYSTDGRSAVEQKNFEKVESKPQALEWIFAKACGRDFCISIDNLDAPPASTEKFKRTVVREAHSYKTSGLPRRALSFYRQLAECYRYEGGIDELQFSINDL